MSMTREDASEILSDGEISCLIGKFHGAKEAFDLALSALRPVSREQVEKVWRGEWIWDTSGLYPKPVCSKCGEEPYRRSNHTSDLPNYCPKCGAPMTNKAVEMVMDRMETLYD